MRTVILCALLGSMAGVGTLRAQGLPTLPGGGTSALPGVIPAPGLDPALGTTLATPLSNPDTSADPVADGFPSGRFYGSAEYLLWWVNGNRLPPLVTTSPAGTPASSAGVLGRPGTEILFGNGDANQAARPGGRFTAGYWLDPDQKCGVEGSFFILGSMAHGFAGSSSGGSILARPFYNTASGNQDSELVAYPGILNGSVTATSGSSQFLGAGALLRYNLCAACWDNGCRFRLDGLAGYRYLHLQENLGIQESLIVTDGALAPLGTSILVGDNFNTTNNFHGGDLGLTAWLYKGPWSANLLGKLGVGATNSTVNIGGNTVMTEPGLVPVVQQGGLLALSSNSGQHTGTHFSLVPELDFNVGYQITSRCRLTAGYTLLFWTGVVRPGDQIDTGVNPNLLPPALPGGDQRPGFGFNRSTLTVQGLSLGLVFNF